MEIANRENAFIRPVWRSAICTQLGDDWDNHEDWVEQPSGSQLHMKQLSSIHAQASSKQTTPPVQPLPQRIKQTHAREGGRLNDQSGHSSRVISDGTREVLIHAAASVLEDLIGGRGRRDRVALQNAWQQLKTAMGIDAIIQSESEGPETISAVSSAATSEADTDIMGLVKSTRHAKQVASGAQEQSGNEAHGTVAGVQKRKIARKARDQHGRHKRGGLGRLRAITIADADNSSKEL